MMTLDSRKFGEQRIVMYLLAVIPATGRNLNIHQVSLTFPGPMTYQVAARGGGGGGGEIRRRIRKGGRHM